MQANNMGDFRCPVYAEPHIASGPDIMRTNIGNIRNASQRPPPIPPPVNTLMTPSYNIGQGVYSGSYFGGGYGGFNNYGGYGNGYPGVTNYGMYNRFGGQYLNANDLENQFIRFAEESSRPAFQSIESLVATVGNIASMLDSTFFAITSTFRAILGVAANFGRLRGVFSQFWHSFAILQSLTWIYKKLLYWLKLSKTDPSAAVFNEAFTAAQNTGLYQTQNVALNAKSQSAWPVLAFLGFIFTAPYLIMKLLGNVMKSAIEESRNPKTWVHPIRCQVVFDFQARSPNELSVRAGQAIYVAPREVQNTHKLLNSGWILATSDGLTSGLIPSTYVKDENQRVYRPPHPIHGQKRFPEANLNVPQVVTQGGVQVVKQGNTPVIKNSGISEVAQSGQLPTKAQDKATSNPNED